MNKQIFSSKERYILKVVLNSKINDYLKNRNNCLTTDFMKYEIDCTIKDIKKILKKIDDPNYKETFVSYNELIKKEFKENPKIKSEVKNAKSKR